MDLEKLTKHQIVLLTLLVSFVTSIATGIITVTLMDQAPTSFVQTINKVVERTIETVVPEKEANEAIATVTQERTVVVSEEDRIEDVVSNVSKSLVRIFSGANMEMFVGIGVVVYPSWAIMTTAEIVSKDSYVVKTYDGQIYSLSSEGSINNAYSVPEYILLLEEDEEVVSPVLEGDPQEKVNLGQRVIALGGESRNIISTGIITDLDRGTLGEVILRTSFDDTVSLPGTLLVDLSGNLLGMWGIQDDVGQFGLISIPEEVEGEEKVAGDQLDRETGAGDQ